MKQELELASTLGYIKSRLKQNGRESGLQKHSKICGYKNLRNYEGLIAKMKEKNVKY